MYNDSERNPDLAHDIDVTENILFPGTDIELRGYLARPDTAQRIGVVLIPDVHGVSPLYRRIASRLAAGGFQTLLLDIYTRESNPVLTDMPAVQRWIDGLNDQQILADTASARDALRSHGATSIAVVGFCLGGQYATMAACQMMGLDAAVSFYGMLDTDTRSPHRPRSALDMAAELRCPLLGLYGAEDPLVSPKSIEAFGLASQDAVGSFRSQIYPNAGHAFLNDTRPEAYRAAVAVQAWAEMLSFLRTEHQPPDDADP